MDAGIVMIVATARYRSFIVRGSSVNEPDDILTYAILISL